MNRNLILSTLFIALFLTAGKAQTITTIAGTGVFGYSGDNGPATAAQVSVVYHLTTDYANNLYVADDNRIRKINSAGVITTIAGTGVAGYTGDHGPATDAQLSIPWGIVVDHIGNIYFCDDGNVRVRKIDTAGIITTIAGNGSFTYSGEGGPATAAGMDCIGITMDGRGNIYFSDPTNYQIHKIDTAGNIHTIAGTGVNSFSGDNGPATAATMNQPYDIVADKVGNVFFNDRENYRIRKIDTAGIITTIAGIGTTAYSGDGGPATAAAIGNSMGIAIDTSGYLYIADSYNSVIRKIDLSGTISTICGDTVAGFSGDNGPATAAEIANPQSVTTDHLGNIFIADESNHRIRKIKPALTTGILYQTGSSSALDVYPNPVRGGVLTVQLNTARKIPASMLITSVTGGKISEITAETNSRVELYLNVPPGIYVLSVTTASETIKREIIVAY